MRAGVQTHEFMKKNERKKTLNATVQELKTIGLGKQTELRFKIKKHEAGTQNWGFWRKKGKRRKWKFGRKTNKIFSETFLKDKLTFMSKTLAEYEFWQHQEFE